MSWPVMIICPVPLARYSAWGEAAESVFRIFVKPSGLSILPASRMFECPVLVIVIRVSPNAPGRSCRETACRAWDR